MKIRNIFLAVAALGMGASFSSCSDDMDYHEYPVYDKEFISETFSSVGGFMTQLYKAMPYDFGNFSGGAMSACATDEAEFSRLGNSIEDFYNGGWTPSNAKSTNWSAMYTAIKAANNFLDNFQDLTFDEYQLNQDFPQQLHRYRNYPYEARFLRAYFYFILVRQYGGVPLVTSDLPADEVNAMPRNTSDEVFEYIFNELTDIKDKIIADYADLGDMALGESETGRAGKIAVLTLRAHAAMYWASPLFNPSNDQSRWQKACEYYQELFDNCTTYKKRLCNKYSDLWSDESFSKAAIVRELLFCTRYYSSPNGDHLVESNSYPVGIEGGKGGNCPTQNLVDAYEMKKTGLPITDPNSGYDPANPYEGRDPRLAMSIAVNGDVWPTYQKNPLELFNGGLNAMPLANATTTGYYLKKLCNGSIDLGANSKFTQSRHTYLNFRFAGALLDYAECAYHATGSADVVPTGCTQTARECIDQVRNRNGVKMPKVPTSINGEAFLEKLKNERFVELCFEGHRFWDVRRWKEGAKYFSSITRCHITKNEDGTFKYEYEKVPRQWDEKFNLFPIPQTEIMKNRNLEQNPGW